MIPQDEFKPKKIWKSTKVRFLRSIIDCGSMWFLGTYNSELITGLIYNELGTSAEQSEFYLVHFRSFFAAIIFLVIIMCTNFPNWVCFHRSQKISALRSHNFTDWTIIFFQINRMCTLNLQTHLSCNHFVSTQEFAFIDHKKILRYAATTLPIGQLIFSK